MSTQDFWHEEPDLLWTYRKVYMDKIKIENERDNQNAWIQGMYIFEAVSVAIYNGFCRKDGVPHKSYTTAPYNFENKNEEEKQIEETKLQEEIIRENLKRGQKILSDTKK